MSSISQAVESAATKVEQFLSSFSSKNVALFYDDDPDGICSGVILEKYLVRKGFNVKLRLHFDKNNTPYSEKFVKLLEDNNVDLLVSTDFCIGGFGYYEEYKQFITNSNIRALIFEHHQDDSIYSFDENKALYINSGHIQTEINGAQYCCSKLVYDVLTKTDPGLTVTNWVAAIGIIGDSNYYTWGNFIKNIIEKRNKNPNVKEILMPEEPDDYYLTPYGKASVYMFFGIGKDRKEIEKIYQATYSSIDIDELFNFLKQYEPIKREAYDYIEDYEYLTKINPPKKNQMNVAEIEITGTHEIGGIVSNIISSKFPETIFFIYHKSTDGNIYIHSRLQTGNINLGKIFDSCAKKVENANGGGHNNAAGAKVSNDQFKAFKNLFYGELENV